MVKIKILLYMKNMLTNHFQMENLLKMLKRELLFIDDNIDNIKSANTLKINTIKVEKSTNLFFEITKVIDNCTFVN